MIELRSLLEHRVPARLRSWSRQGSEIGKVEHGFLFFLFSFTVPVLVANIFISCVFISCTRSSERVTLEDICIFSLEILGSRCFYR